MEGGGGVPIPGHVQKTTQCGNQLLWKGSIKGWTLSWRFFPTCNNPGILNLAAHLGNNQDHTNQKTSGSRLVRHTAQSSSKTPQHRAGLQSAKTQPRKPSLSSSSNQVLLNMGGWFSFSQRRQPDCYNTKNTLISNCSSATLPP